MATTGPFKPDFELTLVPRGAGGGPVIEVSGELDSGGSEELLVVARSAIAGGPAELTLDLRRMTFIDSAGTRALIMIERVAAERGVTLNVTPAPEHVTELLRMAGVIERTGASAEAAPSPPAGSAFVDRTELELPRDPHSPARARLEMRECASERVQPAELANLVLLTSELVTNAVVHPRGVGDTPIGLRITVFRDRVRVEVDDCGEGFERCRPEPPEGVRGRGLFLVDRFSDRWGSGRVHTDGGARFRVWFELDWRDRGTEAVA